MPISIKNADQLNKMRLAGKVVARALEILSQELRPGVTTRELDKIAEEYILSRGAKPNFKGYGGFPAAACISVNDEVIHGIPGLKKVKAGDIVSIDLGAVLNGYHADAARTFAVGGVSQAAARLIAVTERSFLEGVAFARAGQHLNFISGAIEDYVVGNGFAVVRKFVGHGIGASLHEEPQIPNYRVSGRGPKLQAGMTLAVEPMVNEGVCDVVVLQDGWTVVTADGKLSAHYENTLVITDSEPELLTI